MTDLDLMTKAAVVSYTFYQMELNRHGAGKIEQHASSYYEIYLIIDGAANVMLDNGGAWLRSGVCLLLKPG